MFRLKQNLINFPTVDTTEQWSENSSWIPRPMSLLHDNVHATHMRYDMWRKSFQLHQCCRNKHQSRDKQNLYKWNWLSYQQRVHTGNVQFMSKCDCSFDWTKGSWPHVSILSTSLVCESENKQMYMFLFLSFRIARCGPWASSACTDEKWFEFMGDKDTPNVPFPINYKFHNVSDVVDNFTPFNGRVIPCNESADVSI